MTRWKRDLWTGLHKRKGIQQPEELKSCCIEYLCSLKERPEEASCPRLSQSESLCCHWAETWHRQWLSQAWCLDFCWAQSRQLYLHSPPTPRLFEEHLIWSISVFNINLFLFLVFSGNLGSSVGRNVLLLITLLYFFKCVRFTWAILHRK